MKIRVLMLTALMLAPSAAQADPRDDVFQSLLECTKLPGKMDRADCLDRLTPDLRAAAQAPPVAAAPPAAEKPMQQAALPDNTTPPPQPGPPPEQNGSWLGEWNPFKGNAEGPSPQQMAYQPFGQEILPVTIAVTDFSLGMNGFTVTLENGQVWQGNYGANPIPPFHHDNTNVVVIDHGMLGGFKLNIRGSSNLYKVVRVK